MQKSFERSLHLGLLQSFEGPNASLFNKKTFLLLTPRSIISKLWLKKNAQMAESQFS